MLSVGNGPAGPARRAAPAVRAASEEAAHAASRRLREARGSLNGPLMLVSSREALARHIAVLAAALEAGNERVFARYCEWLSQVLVARGARDDELVVALEAVRAGLAPLLSPAAAAAAQRYLARGVESATWAPALLSLDPAKGDVRERDALVDALLAGDSSRAAAVVDDALARGRSPVEVGDRTVRAAMAEIGRRWQFGGATVAQEHLATSTLQVLLVRLLPRVPPAGPGSRRALLACVECNSHSLGLWIVASAFEVAGWSVHNLGADAPEAAVLEEVRRWKPDVLGLSLAMAPDLSRARRLVEALREQEGAHAPRVILGGAFVNEFPEAAAELGDVLCAEGARDAVEAVARSPR